MAKSLRSAEERRPYHHGDLERTLIDAAVSIIRETGVESLSLRGIAREAGVSHAAPYHHFPDRRSLLTAVARRGLQMLLLAMQEAMAKHPQDALLQFQAAGVAYVVFAVREPHLFRLIFTVDSPEVRTREVLRQPCQHSVLQLAREKVIHATDEEIDTITAAAWALVHGLAELALDGQFSRKLEKIERTARQITSIFLTGVLARRPGASLSR